MEHQPLIIGVDDPILITGANGYIGARVVENLLARGFRHLRCFVRPSSAMAKLEATAVRQNGRARIEIFKGNLLSRENCLEAAKDVAVIFHLAAGVGEKSVPDAF